MPPTLSTGFPARREDLYSYDAVIVSNVEGDFFTRDQWTMIADFVSERGGGLLVTGGRSFAQRGLVGTPVEAVLPVELDERRGGTTRAVAGDRAPANGLVVTPEGETHPIMRLGASGEETRRKWAALAGAGGDRAARRCRGRVPSCSRPRRPPAAPSFRSSPCSGTAADARWCSAARRRGAGG